MDESSPFCRSPSYELRQREGPLVLAVPPTVLGAANDMWQRYRLPTDLNP
jgi:hypothetical protein